MLTGFILASESKNCQHDITIWTLFQGFKGGRTKDRSWPRNVEDVQTVYACLLHLLFYQYSLPVRNYENVLHVSARARARACVRACAYLDVHAVDVVV